MATVEEEARNATLRMYDALDHLLLGKGTQPMSEAWHHDEFVTTVHPFGHWARGWEEVWATWEEIAAVFSMYRGHVHRQDGIGAIHDLRVTVLGEVAYGIGVYKSCLYLPEGETHLSVNCTNVLLQRGGVWKMIHHHPDQAPSDYQAALARMVESAQP
jgi:ketosteroid isomerase-like protein